MISCSLYCFCFLAAVMNAPAEESQAKEAPIPIVLKGENANVRGLDIQIEKPTGNIGFWHSTEDEVKWRTEVPAGKYEIFVDYASANDHKENVMSVEIGDRSLKWSVPGTGGWGNYRQVQLGEVELKNAVSEVRLLALTLRQGEALCDLRTVVVIQAGSKPDWSRLLPQLETVESILAKGPSGIAQAILNESLDGKIREELTDRCDEHVDAIMKELVKGIDGNLQEEYRRIPWIWRVAIKSAKRNDAEVIRSLLASSLPAPKDKLRDWQAVVLGGGVINGLGLIGIFPQERLAAILEGEASLKEKYDFALDQALAMAENQEVATGTRYDALRMVAMLPWEKSKPVLSKYIQADAHAELQMGATSGLVDIPTRESEELLCSSLAGLTEGNRSMAIEGLLRTKEREEFLRKKLKNGDVKESWLTDPQRDILLGSKKK